MAGGPTEGGPDVGGLTAGGPGSPLTRRPGNGDILRGGTLGVSVKTPFPGRAEPYPGPPAAFTPLPPPWRALHREDGG